LGEKTTGVTLITMAEQFDTGHIVAKASVPITPKDTRESLYDKLYTLGSKELPAWLLRHYHWQQKQHFYCQQTLAPTPQSPASPTPYAYMFKRSDGFIPWDSFVKAMTGSPLHPGDFPGRHFQTAVNFLKDHHLLKEPNALAHFIERAVRALHGYPGIWTTIKTPKGKKRLKIHSSHVKKAHLILQTVQLEGQAPSSFNQIKTSLTTNV
jgi:methionyl-tRNA formyltransferase